MSPRQTKDYVVTGRARRDYRREGAVMLLLAFGLVNSGVSALVDPAAAANTSVARVLPESAQSVEATWQVAYILAGVLIAVGVLRPSPVSEVLGEWMAGWALLMNTIALLVLRGPAGTGTSLGAFLMSIAVCALRISLLHDRARRERRHRDMRFVGPERRR